MIRQQRDMPPAECKWTGWPTEFRRSIMVIIATTRYAWSPQVAGDVPNARATARQV